jgi:hypothetical protein
MTGGMPKYAGQLLTVGYIAGRIGKQPGFPILDGIPRWECGCTGTYAGPGVDGPAYHWTQCEKHRDLDVA